MLGLGPKGQVLGMGGWDLQHGAELPVSHRAHPAPRCQGQPSVIVSMWARPQSCFRSSGGYQQCSGEALATNGANQTPVLFPCL